MPAQLLPHWDIRTPKELSQLALAMAFDDSLMLRYGTNIKPYTRIWTRPSRAFWFQLLDNINPCLYPTGCWSGYVLSARAWI